jgi:hypothetical protein
MILHHLSPSESGSKTEMTMTYETSTANTNSKLLKYLKSTFTNYFVTDTSGVIKDYLKNLMHGHLQEKVLASNFEVEGNNKHTDHL